MSLIWVEKQYHQTIYLSNMNIIIKIIRLPFVIPLYLVMFIGGIISGDEPSEVVDILSELIWPDY